MEEAAADPVDIVLSAIVGAAGLRATTAAIRSGSDIALANKECLICAGSAFMALARWDIATVGETSIMRARRESPGPAAADFLNEPSCFGASTWSRRSSL